MDVQLVLTRLTAAAATALSTPALKMTAYDYVPDQVEAPCVLPQGVQVAFDQTMNRGTDKLTVRLRLLCPATDDREGQRMLWRYLAGSGAGSLKAAIEAARGAPGAAALGGACDDLRVSGIGEARWIEHGGETYVGAEFTVDIYGSGT